MTILAPVFTNVYVLAPLGVIVNESHEHIEPLFTEIVGIVFTVIVPVCVPLTQPPVGVTM